jgi:tRNA (guanine-N7-)-methyltransferase
MRRRVRHHVNPLQSEFAARTVPRLPLPDKPVEVELGCADAQFLFERAPQHPDRHFLGLEIRVPLVEEVNERAAEAGLSVQAIFAHINYDLGPLFDDERLSRVFINFPDPWFKRRHHKRRLVTPELVEELHRKLASDGELFFQSDVWDLALEAMAVFEEFPHLFANVAGPWSFTRHNPYGARSDRERRCEAKSMRIWRILYRKRALPEG